MDNTTLEATGSYIVRDKRGTYMGAYSEKLGKSKAINWATECAKRSRGVIYFRASPSEEEKQIASYLDFGRKNKSDSNRRKGS